jgi:hypothetical protein
LRARSARLNCGQRIVPNSKYLAERLRAHARLYRHIAEQTWSEDTAEELGRLADECAHAANAIAAAIKDDSVEPGRLA